MNIYKYTKKTEYIYTQRERERQRQRETERISNCDEVRFLIILEIIRKEELTQDVCLSKNKSYGH